MKFAGYVGYDTRNNLKHFGDILFNPLGIGFLFYFLGPCLLATSRNTGWMDIHEIFRIWTQEAIGYTVSRLRRLFHALHTRRGRGLRSRSASCCQLDPCGQISVKFNQNTELCIHENAPEYVVCEMTAILSRGRWFICNSPPPPLDSHTIDPLPVKRHWRLRYMDPKYSLTNHDVLYNH